MELSDEEQELVQISHPIIIELIARFISIIQLLRERNHELENRNREL